MECPVCFRMHATKPAEIGPDHLLTLFRVLTWSPATSGKDRSEEGSHPPGLKPQGAESPEIWSSRALDTTVGVWKKPEGSNEQL